MRRAVASLLAGIFVLLLSGGTASADHTIYEAEAPTDQLSGFLGKENYAFYYWAVISSNLEWWATSALRNEVLQAKDAWGTQLPRLSWLEVSQQDADVTFLDAACGAGIVACIIWTEFYDGEVENRNGNYWTKAEIRIDTNAPWGPNARLAAIAHEVGHLYGLAERYHHGWPPGSPSACNQSETTIMDTVYLSGGQWVHCDGLMGPTALDTSRVTTFWSTGAFDGPVSAWGYMTAVAGGEGSHGVWAWWDKGWAELRHQPKWFWLNGSVWVEYLYRPTTDHAGVHRTTQDRWITQYVNRNTYGIPPAWHLMCGDLYFLKWDTAGQWKCSYYIWLD